jgi:hypothetical protein
MVTKSLLKLGKDFVHIFCSFLTMPLGTIARLVEKESIIGIEIASPLMEIVMNVTKENVFILISIS